MTKEEIKELIDRVVECLVHGDITNAKEAEAKLLAYIEGLEKKQLVDYPRMAGKTTLVENEKLKQQIARLEKVMRDAVIILKSIEALISIHQPKSAQEVYRARYILEQALVENGKEKHEARD